jgi:hypothetical protein
MLKGNDIVYVSNDWYTEHKTSSHQISERLALEGNRILYVEAAGLRKPKANSRDIKKIIKKVKGGLEPPKMVMPNLFLLSALVIPFHKIKMIRKFNQIIVIWKIKHACKKIGIKKPILWIFLPHLHYLSGKLREKGLVYYCVDEYSTLPNTDSSAIRNFEVSLLKKANVVFAVSTVLRDKKKKKNKNTYYSPHGVDINNFRKAIDGSTLIPKDIRTIGKPIVGIFGLIDDRVDLELIEHIAKMRPKLSIVIIGKASQNISSLKSYSNIHFLGWRHYEKLPGYLKVIDVAMIPYRINELTINSNPLKLKEYLAGGVSVVTIDIPAVAPYKDLVYIAKGYDDFVKKIDLALLDRSKKYKIRRANAMLSESWEARIENISGIVSENIPDVLNNQNMSI